jgi:putative membrane protein
MHQRRQRERGNVTCHRRRGEREFVGHYRRNDPDLWKGVVAGLLGGFAGSWTMNQFQAGWSKVVNGAQNNGGNQGQKQTQSFGSEPATMKVAEKLSEVVIHRELSPEEKQKAEPIVHYAFGAAMGGLYGAAAELLPAARKGAGLPFGTVLFVGADEIAVPKLGLSKPATEYPLSTHAQALASHLIYGLTTEVVRRSIRWAL